MQSYITSIIVAAIICAVAGILLPPKSAGGQIVKLLCGGLLVITIVSPLANISFDGITEYLDGLTVSANAYVNSGTSDADNELASIIKARSESYILDKATAMDLRICVEVSLDKNNNFVPCAVRITGSISPYAKEIMSEYITNTLGIEKEKQQWISKEYSPS